MVKYETYLTISKYNSFIITFSLYKNYFMVIKEPELLVKIFRILTKCTNRESIIICSKCKGKLQQIKTSRTPVERPHKVV